MYSAASRLLAAGEECDVWYEDQRNLSACAGNHHNPAETFSAPSELLISSDRRVAARRSLTRSRGPRGALIYLVVAFVSVWR